MKKRIAAWLMILTLALSALSAAAAAKGCEMTLKVGDVEVPLTVGADVRVPVTATINTGYVALIITFAYDSDALELYDVEYSDLAPDEGSAPIENTGEYTVYAGNALSVDNLTGTGVFFTLVFRVTDAAHSGNYRIAVTHTDSCDTDLDDVDVIAVDGTVTLADDGSAFVPSDPTASAEDTGDFPEATSVPDDPTSAPVDSDNDDGADNQMTVTTGSDPSADGDRTVLWLLLVGAAIVLSSVATAVIVKSRSKGNRNKKTK